MIHVFKQNEIQMVLDVNSGAVHILDDIGYEILKESNCILDMKKKAHILKERFKQSEINETLNELYELVEEGSLFSKMGDVSFLNQSTQIDMKALCLHIAHDCNLRCKYCFAGEGDYHQKKSVMSLEIAKKAIDFLLKNGKRKHLEVDFFGGEPFLNFEVMKECVAYAKQVQKDQIIHFTVTTNGTIMNDEIKKFINEHMDNVVLSFDGRKSVHDGMRVFNSKKGSYDVVVKNIKEILHDRKKGTHFIRGTFTRENLDFYEDVKLMSSLGFKEISLEPVTGGDFEFHQDEIECIKKEYERFSTEYASQNDYRFYHFNLNMYHGPCLQKRIRACGAGFEYASVVPDGSIYACHQFAGMDEFLLGNVHDGITNHELVSKMANTNVLTKEDCKKCWARFFCSGGCHAIFHFQNKDLSKPHINYCELQKKRIECALTIEARRNMTYDRSN